MYKFLKVVFCVFCVVALSSMVSFFTQRYKVERSEASNPLTNDQGVLLREVVLGNLEVQRSGALANTAGNIVM